MNANFVIDNSKTQHRKNSHFFICKSENRPLVAIRHSRRYSYVEIDMFTTDRNLDNATADEICKVLIKYSEPSAEVWRSLIACQVERVKKEVAETVATQIYDIAFKAMPRLKHCCG